MSSCSETVDINPIGAGPPRVDTAAPNLSGRHVDEAVDSVIAARDVPENTGNIIKELLARDANSEVATAYFQSYNARGTNALRTNCRRAVVKINYVLSDDQVRCLDEYAPEYDIRYGNKELHDHPMAAAMRTLDHAIICSRIPAVSRVTDVGGDPLFHILKGNVNVHCCNPAVDVKDDSRKTVRDVTVATLKNRDYERLSSESKIMVESYLNGSRRHFCSEAAQVCTVPSPIITVVHVYDVPLADWPLIMENKGADIVEGALLFPNKLFVDAEGELPDSGMRYAIDVAGDEFRMGFINSPSWWYRHKWSHYIRYGVDQRLVYGDNVYSYKVVERRKDTIFFRILAVRPDGTDFGIKTKIPTWKVPVTKAFLYPEVRMVEVDGFDFDSTGKASTRGVLRRRKFSVAAPLWEGLVNIAAQEFARGVLDFQKMFNAYRTLAPRHTINGVLVSGGYSVDPDELDVVVIHASIIGAMRSQMDDRTTRAMTDSAFRKRSRLSQTTASKIASALGDLLKMAAYSAAVISGIRSMIEALNRGLTEVAVLDFIAEVYEPVVKRVSVDRLFVKRDESLGIQTSNEPGELGRFAADSVDGSLHDLLGAALYDYGLAKFFYDNFQDVVGGEVKAKLEKVMHDLRPKERVADGVVGSDRACAGDGTTAARTQARNGDGESQDVLADSNWRSKTEKRVAAIQEAIAEINAETSIINSVCKRLYSTCVHANGINIDAMKRDEESYGYPDFWRVTGGTLADHSVRGVPTRDFSYAVAYANIYGQDSVKNFVKVAPHEYLNDNNDIEVNYTTKGVEFTGYILVYDALTIYNGPDIVKSLQCALRLKHEYEVVLAEGPPGCGKTHSIVELYKEGDFVMCPVRESSTDTNGRLQKKHPGAREIQHVVKTLDSFLIHGVSDKCKLIQFDRILADECFMAHSGKWYAAAALLGVKQIRAYGDRKQIPHIPRVNLETKHVQLEFDTRTFNPITRRCPADAVAAWCDLYDNLVRSTNTITKSLFEVASHRSVKVSPDTCLMGMFQSDKKEIRRLFPNHEKNAKGGKLIVTAHEAEGKTYREVVLFRFDRRIRRDKMSLYDQQPHVLVALSRHTERFTYVRADGLGDLVSKMIALSRNPRRIKEILDIDKAGRPYG